MRLFAFQGLGRQQALNEIMAAAGTAGGVISILFGGGYLISRARRERDWGEAFGKLREQVSNLAADLAALRYDFDALQWSVTQEPQETQIRIFDRARIWRRRDQKDADQRD